MFSHPFKDSAREGTIVASIRRQQKIEGVSKNAVTTDHNGVRIFICEHNNM
jgi:hypothetical protein